MTELLKQATEYEPTLDYFRVATATPEVSVGDIEYNCAQITHFYQEAVGKSVDVVVFPELSVTGYTLGDLVQRPALLDDAKEALGEIANLTSGQETAMIVGLPLEVGNGLYNCAALCAHGQVIGIVPKQNLPNYKEFYEKRWYQTWDDRPNTTVAVNDQDVAFGRKQIFDIGGTPCGIEICEDLWVPRSPSLELTENGAQIIFNPSASPEHVAKASSRRAKVGEQASKLMAAYIYTSADPTESTMDIVMSGHAIISELGHQLAERKPYAADNPRLMIADIDTSHIAYERRNYLFPNEFDILHTKVPLTREFSTLLRTIDSRPFQPKGTREEVAERFDELLSNRAYALASRLRSTSSHNMVLGLSGGLDSTLALLTCYQAANILGLEPSGCIDTLTMPAEASSERTQSNAVKLAAALGIKNTEIPIADLATAQLEALGREPELQDVTFENTHARIRTALLFNHANAHRGLVIGTGDMTEIALGWSTYNGDHMSHYNVNCSTPKTLVRDLTAYAAQQLPVPAREVVYDILDTPISPELTGNGGSISQETEAILGPYEIHDFVLWEFLRWGSPIEKIKYLAHTAFENSYPEPLIDRTIDTFFTRFSFSQFKRSVMADGPKSGSISLSPRGDWRMPSDMRVIVR